MLMRPSSLKERQEFYDGEFNLKDLGSWLRGKIKPQIYEIDAGTETRVAKDKKDIGKLFVLSIAKRSLHKTLLNLKKECMQRMPEDVYYDRNIYRNVAEVIKKKNYRSAISTRNWRGQELAFDLDPENVKCECKKRKIKEIFKFCPSCLQETKDKTLEMHDFLKQCGFKKVNIVYSGRGYHLHVFDKKAFRMSLHERSMLNKKLLRFRFPIDPWVSRGRIRLIRLPYSLNALVSRVCLPLTKKELEKFGPYTSKIAMPRFLR